MLNVGLLSSPLHQWLESTCTYFSPPPGLGAVPNANGNEYAPIGVAGYPLWLAVQDLRSMWGGYAGRDRLPARGATLIDIEFRVRTANSDNGNHWVALPTEGANQGAPTAPPVGVRPGRQR